MSRAIHLLRLIAALVFGLVLPILLLIQSQHAMAGLDSDHSAGDDLAQVVGHLPASVAEMRHANDFALLSLAFIEASNQRTVLFKQRMKLSVMQVGFAVISLGLMFILLGFDVGGLDLKGEATGAGKLDLKVASTGLACVVLGAAMVAAAGMLPNHYETAGLPEYIETAPAPSRIADTDRHDDAELLERCRRDTRGPDQLRICIENVSTMRQQPAAPAR